MHIQPVKKKLRLTLHLQIHRIQRQETKVEYQKDLTENRKLSFCCVFHRLHDCPLSYFPKVLIKRRKNKCERGKRARVREKRNRMKEKTKCMRRERRMCQTVSQKGLWAYGWERASERQREVGGGVGGGGQVLLVGLKMQWGRQASVPYICHSVYSRARPSQDPLWMHTHAQTHPHKERTAVLIHTRTVK